MGPPLGLSTEAVETVRDYLRIRVRPSAPGAGTMPAACASSGRSSTRVCTSRRSEESRAAFVGGNRFKTTLPDAAKRVRFRLLTGDDERKLPALE